MPGFAFHRPRFLRFHRSRSRSPEPSSPSAPHDDGLGTGSHCSGFDSSPVSPSHPLSTAGENLTDHHNSTQNRPVDSESDDFEPQTSRGSQVVTPSFVPNTASMFGPQRPVALHLAHLPHPFDPIYIGQPEQQLLHTPYSLTTSSQVPPDSHHLTVSFICKFHTGVEYLVATFKSIFVATPLSESRYAQPSP